MSNPFVLQQKVLKQILKEKPSVKDGMAAALKTVQAAKHGEAWKERGPLDWAKLEAKWVKWFDALLKKHPPKKKVGLLWFEVLSDINPAMTSVSGYQKLNRANEDFGLEAGRFWPVDREGSTVEAGMLYFPEVDRFFADVGWELYEQLDEEPSEESQKTRDRLYPGYCALSFAVVTLLVINGLSRTKFLAEAGASEVGVMVGWVEGGEEPIGILSGAGWKPLKLDRKSLEVSPEYLDPAKGLLYVDKYLARGGDPNWRDKKTGETVLMKYNLNSARDHRLLIEAGADVNAVDRQGESVLHHLGACELPTLQLLIKGGVKPNQRCADGPSAFDQVCWDGRCTVSHIEMLWKAGGRPTKDKEGMPRPLRDLARSDVSGSKKKISRDILRFWLGKRIHLAASDREGYSPLWVSLDRHAKQWAEWVSFSGKERADKDWWLKYVYDETAIMFLEHGADANGRLKKSKSKLIPAGATPLMVRRYDRAKLVKALLEHGADPLAKSAEGKTALDYARAAAEDPKRLDAEGAKKIVKLLEKAVAAAEKKGGSKKK